MRLSDFKNEKGLEVVGDLLELLPVIAANPKNKEAAKKSPVLFASSMLKNTPKETMRMLAIINDEDPEDYECNAATALKSVFETVTDPVLLDLFGLKRQIPASPASATGSGEAEVELPSLPAIA